MNKQIIFRTIQTMLAVFIVILIQKCGGDNSVNAPGDSMSGTITYTSTNLRLTGGHYAVSFYADSSNPFSHPPLRSDSLAPGVGGGLASAYYKSTGFTTGNYYIASTWIRNDGVIHIIGGYQCDITPHCPAPTKVVFPNYAGTRSLDFLSRTDPDSTIYP
jgi:hypothetical protein